MSAKINKLLVKVNGVPAGHVSTRITDDGGLRYSFTYLPDAGPEQALSVTMPIRDESYSSWQVPPALEMSLPEGALKEYLVNRFNKTIYMDPMGLLFVTSRSRIGNISVKLPDDAPRDLAELENSLVQHQKQQDAINTEDITGVTDPELESLFEDLLDRYAIGSGVSGVQPKVLAKTLVGSANNPDKMTLRSPGHIVKTSDNDLPFLSLNEHLCLKVAMRVGLDVPRRVLSDNGEVLILKRFDINRQGGRYHVEDGCVLLTKPANGRYDSSLEKLVGALLATIPRDKRLASAKVLFTQVVLNTLVRNGDGHLKNFMILYDRPENARLSKVFDITTTAAYIRKDEQALVLNGSKNWPSEKDLIRLGRERCGLEQRDCRQIIQKTIEAVKAVGKRIPNEIEKYPGSEHVLTAMVQQWNGAIKSLYAKKTKDIAAIRTELDDVESALITRYGDPYQNQKDRKTRLSKISGPQRTVMHPPTL